VYFIINKEKMSKKKKPLIVVVNDDGVDAQGIRALASVAQEFGRVVMVAPGSGKSGMSHAITFISPLRLRRLFISPDMEIYKTNGTPADSVKLAVRHLLKNQHIDLLVSGINQGGNTAVNVIYSGTVAGAVEGCLSGIPSIAFSIVNYDKNCNFETAKTAARQIIASVLEKGLPPNICLNVNIPHVDVEAIKGYKITRQANNFWSEVIEMREDTMNNPYFWMGGKMQDVDIARDTDHWAVSHNYISVHPINTNWTDKQMIKELKKWKLTF
jgi:5'-nucleotidase